MIFPSNIRKAVAMWVLEAGTGVGPLSLGMTEDQSRAILGPVSSIFRRTPESTEDVIAYDVAGVHLTVDQERRVRQISVFPPNEVCLSGVQLLGRKVAEVATDMKTTRFRFQSVDAGLWCPAANVLLVEVDGMVDGVEIGPLSGCPS